MNVKARCPECNAEVYLRRGTVVTSSTNGRKVKCEAAGDWNECFCGALFLALKDGTRLIKSGRVAQVQAQAVAGAPNGVAPEDHRPKPVMPKARA